MFKLTTLERRRWLTVVVTVGLALLSGHWMQSRLGSSNTPPDGPLSLPNAPTFTAILQPAPRFPERVTETRSPRSAGCAPRMQVHEMPGASLRVTLQAPCHKDEPLRLTFNELTADDVTDANGRWEARLPNLGPLVNVALDFGDYRLSEAVNPAEPLILQHVILSWTGAKTFEIQAEAQTNQTLVGTEMPDGMLTQVGDGRGAAFEIYSFPAQKDSTVGVIRLSVDALVTEDNCGSTVATTAFQTGFITGLRRTDISYTMPECERVGDVVRLQNLFRDMRLAAR